MSEIHTIDEYIAQFPKSHQKQMKELRMIIKQNAPEASEKISWGMATFVLHKNLMHFAANKNHIGFYPTPSGVAHFLDELKDYKTTKGGIQFPIDRPLPKVLIAKIVKYRVEENKTLQKK
ncbi:uncharacterized protein YdhG (YjbR/CyaY superfamily) [Breznakia sp. PF5-3]|uniref:iron chaperone n=1 Tax=unclassified Breznakia TaxID=2623764 RepID=UPI002405DF6C|nr:MULTISPECIES: DUF1801 domain-containing protein [unclassified Breznakia]MDF9825431.1 uncharacterized protein YdhG (YjbR/CyaY superfamily) [Breznakia sp. PM6-1]MDF9836309.1 uncharacterized protein YdhG (YjbR/CyaY superfamily) [Breznakia sp. PF5-3]MDF9838540.1 uncharacterized protein YdhG (YjbR/CyaY superfamily) [Breznakia sp. PFB2-8]MDF9860576.1 uncharacterized protein YdhG (YjbR/CyaY superfamily) [Breznakia sp. PH5-24]